MFTGIIEETGRIEMITRKNQSLEISYMADKILDRLKKGDSVSVNGVCQTVTAIAGNKFTTDISETTLEKTTVSKFKKDDMVNFERAMKADSRFDGHIVQGHINGTGSIKTITKKNGMHVFSLELTSDLMKYIVPEGSIAVDGISLTVAAITDSNSILLQIIPLTYEDTILKYKKIRDLVNIETDIIGRYIESLLSKTPVNGISKSKLRGWGY